MCSSTCFFALSTGLLTDDQIQVLIDTLDVNDTQNFDYTEYFNSFEIIDTTIDKDTLSATQNATAMETRATGGAGVQLLRERPTEHGQQRMIALVRTMLYVAFTRARTRTHARTHMRTHTHKNHAMSMLLKSKTSNPHDALCPALNHCVNLCCRV